MKKKHVIIPIFVPHKGCPHDCVFCNQKKISGQEKEMTATIMRSTIEEYLPSIKHDSFIELAFYGGSFTGIKKEDQISYLEISREYLRRSQINAIRLSTRPDYINDEILNYLKEYGVTTIELGVQSFDEDVLKSSCRGHSIDDSIRSSEMIKKYDFNLGIQTMIGLPEDNKEKDIFTANKVISLKPDLVRIYPTLVIRDTFLETQYINGKYVPLSLDEAVDICSSLLEIYKSNNINVIRIGLQPSDNISMDGDIIAGPFHPAFRQLVEARLILNMIEKCINKEKLSGIKELRILASESRISDVIGQKKDSINYLKNKYKFKNIIVNTDKDIGEEIFIYKKSNNCWIKCY